MIDGKRILKCAVPVIAAVALTGCGVPKEEHETLEKKYTKVQAEMAGFNQQVKEVQQKNASLGKEMESLQAKVRTLEGENADLKGKIRERESQITELVSQKKILEKKQEDLSKKPQE